MKLSWHRQATPYLYLPPVCAATGQPTDNRMPIIYRNKLATYLPRIGWILAMANRPVVMPTPVTPEVQQRITRLRLTSLAGILGGLVLAVLLGVVVNAAGGSGAGGALLGPVLVVVVIGGYVVYLLGSIKADLLSTDVRGDSISMGAAHPAFVDAVVRMNPPGTFRVEGVPAGQPSRQTAGLQYPQPNAQQYPQQYGGRPGWAPQAPGHPQQQYPQPQPGYPLPQPGYPLPRQPQPGQSYDPVPGYHGPDQA